MRCTAVFILLMTTWILGGCAAQRQANPRVNDVVMTANGRQVLVALENYALQHDDHYPPAKDFPSGLVTYLDEAMLPIGPEAIDDSRQRNSILLAPPLLGVASGKTTPLGHDLGPGTVATSDTFGATTFGAFIYDADRAGRHYVLYGVGRQGDRAVVAFSARGPITPDP